MPLRDDVPVMDLYRQGREQTALVQDLDQRDQALLKFRVLCGQDQQSRPHLGVVPLRHEFSAEYLHKGTHFQRRCRHGEGALVSWMKSVGKGLGLREPPMEAALPIMVFLDLGMVHIDHKPRRFVARR